MKKELTRKGALERALDHGWCRAVAHSWAPDGPIRLVAKGYEMRVRCANCDTVRKTVVNRYGKLIGNSYGWPDDYLLTSRTKLSKADMRKLVVVECRPFKINPKEDAPSEVHYHHVSGRKTEGEESAGLEQKTEAERESKAS